MADTEAKTRATAHQADNHDELAVEGEMRDQVDQQPEMAAEVTKTVQDSLFLPENKETEITKPKIKKEKNEEASIQEQVAQPSEEHTLALSKEKVETVAEKLHNFSPLADAGVNLELQTATFERYFNSDDKYTKTTFIEELDTYVKAVHGDWPSKDRTKAELKLALEIGQYSDVYTARSEYNLARISEAAANEIWHNCNERLKRHKQKAAELMKARRKADKLVKRRAIIDRKKELGARPVGGKKRSTLQNR